MAALQASLLKLNISCPSALSSGGRECKCPSRLFSSSSSNFPAPSQWRQRSLSVSALAENEAPAEAVAVEEVAEEEVDYAGNDELLLYFKAEGSLTESAIPRVTKALEAVEGVDNVRVTVLEGCATAECTKATTVQAAAAASSLVEALQGSGFGLQTVSLGFNDDGTESAEELLKVYTEDGGDLLYDAPAQSD